MMKYPFILLFFLLTGCVSYLPKEISDVPYTQVSFAEVNANRSAYQGKSLRWGGKIVMVSNQENESQAQLLYYPLNRYGKPSIRGESKGRFAISRTELLDPAIYKEGTEVTVAGVLSGEVTQKIGKKKITLPLLKAIHIHIWPEYQEMHHRFQYYDTYHYAPYPYSPYPYYRYPAIYDNNHYRYGY